MLFVSISPNCIPIQNLSPSQVLVLLVINALHVAFTVKTLNYYLIGHFGDYAALFFTDWWVLFYSFAQFRAVWTLH